MARLIDAEKLEEALVGRLPYQYITERVVKSMPTIEAIPIEWLLRWAEDRYFLMTTSDGHYLGKLYYSPMFKDAVKDWHEERGCSNENV